MVSIIIPIYNVELYLHDCLESLNRQTIKDFEVILLMIVHPILQFKS